MRKIFKIFLAFAMIFSVLQTQHVEAEEYSVSLKNFNMKNYQEVYEITAGTQLPVEYEIESNIPEEYYPDYTIHVLFKEKDGTVGTLRVIDNVLFTFEEQKYEYDELEFLAIRFYTTYWNGEEDVNTWKYYSSYSLETIQDYLNNDPNTADIENYFYNLNESNFSQLDIQPFTVKFTDYEEVNNPDLTSIEVTQNGKNIEAVFTINEVKKGDYTRLGLYFELNMLVDQGDYFSNETFELNVVMTSIEYLGLIDEKPTYRATGELNNSYISIPYGDYHLARCRLDDVAIQDREFYPDTIIGMNEQKITYDESLNIFVQIKDEDIICPKRVIRACDDYRDSINLNVNISEGQVLDLNVWQITDLDGNYLDHPLDGLNVDTTQPQTITRKIVCYYTAGYNNYKTVTVDYVLTIIDENGLGTIVIPEKDFEVCVKREDVINEYGEFDAHEYPFTVPVLLNDGTYTTTTITIGRGNTILINDENCPYGYVDGEFYAPIEYNPQYIEYLKIRVYMQDDNGNLVDDDGNIIVAYENRKDIVHESNNNAVSVTSLEGSVPTYTTVNAVEENVDDIFEEESIGYDITLNAVNNAVQPVDDVKVSIDLPENLQDKEVEVYYVDDEGNTELVESSSDGETVTFETDHFSTYAVVEKKVDDTENNDQTTKPADYSKVEEAKEKIPSDLSIYTDESVYNLNVTLMEIDSRLDITQQEIVDNYAKEILDAIDGLILKDADYSALDAVLKTIPSDLSVYTEESLKALEKAIKDVEEGLKITEQDKVDAAIQEIEDAIKNLKLKENPTEPEKPTDPEEPTKPEEGVDTGDHSNIGFYLVTFFVAAVVLAYIVIKDKKQVNN